MITSHGMKTKGLIQNFIISLMMVAVILAGADYQSSMAKAFENRVDSFLADEVSLLQGEQGTYVSATASKSLKQLKAPEIENRIEVRGKNHHKSGLFLRFIIFVTALLCIISLYNRYIVGASLIVLKSSKTVTFIHLSDGLK